MSLEKELPAKGANLKGNLLTANGVKGWPAKMGPDDIFMDLSSGFMVSAKTQVEPVSMLGPDWDAPLKRTKWQVAADYCLPPLLLLPILLFGRYVFSSQWSGATVIFQAATCILTWRAIAALRMRLPRAPSNIAHI